MTSENRKIGRLFEPAHKSVGGMWKARKGADALAVYQLAIHLGWRPHGPELYYDPEQGFGGQP
ncbi:hypothetical protein [Smaragdicoccus niigatensis]|uniref:hypothetical protein n=1 Tax=Smaragdicoccus niigatensis TaxID=359359 RepID=UPI000370FFB2|nr:hypothetical protein [Smaragdicoccus niigatensis]